MQEFVIDYNLKESMDNKEFAQYHIKKFILHCKDHELVQTRTLIEVNRLCEFVNFEPIKFWLVKYYW